MGASFNPRSDEHEARVLAQLADGSLPERERAAVEAYVAGSSEAQARLAEQQIVARTLRAGGPAMPDTLRTRLDRQSRPARRGIGVRRPGPGWLAPLAALGVALAVALVLLSGSRAGTPTIEQAARLAYVRPTRPAPGPDAAHPGRLAESFGGVPFPDYVRAFGAYPTGQRTDHTSGRVEQTVYYRLRTGERISYTIVSGSALPLPGKPRRAVVVRGTAIQAYAEGSLNYVTLVRSGRSCVLAGRVPTSILIALATNPLSPATQTV